MSAKKAEPAEGGKKKGKMPIMLVLALVIGGGGFFMMKGKGDKKKEPEVKLGEIAPFPKEFLVNLKDGGYLKTEIALQFKEGFDVKTKFEHEAAAVQNEFVLILSDLKSDDVKSFANKLALKKKLAEAANEVLNEGAEEKEKKKKKKKSDEGEEPENPSWDSDQGPVLKVLFTSFATQE